MNADFDSKVQFILLLGRSLHGCGAAAHHLERALTKLGSKLGLISEYLAFPTGILASFTGEGQHRSYVVRTEPGEIDLSKLSRIDEAADLVVAGQLTVSEGMQRIQEINASPADYHWLLLILSYALASGGMVTALHGSHWDLLVASGVGLLVGSLQVFGARWYAMRQLFGAMAACLSVVIAVICSRSSHKINPDIVILAGIIVLLPGLSLVVSFVELSTKNLVSGTARLAGATADLLKIVFTVALTKVIMHNPVLPANLDSSALLPAWSEVPGIAGFALGSLVLFRVRPSNALSAYLVSLASYSIARLGSTMLGTELSFFVAGAFVAMVSNLLAKVLKRPGLITLLPGIVLIVPGSINYRGFIALFQRDIIDSATAFFSVIIIAVSIVAGLFFGNTIIPPRRSL